MSTPHRPHIILASGSGIRKQIMENAGLAFTVRVGDVDEGALKEQALAQNKTPQEIAGLLALAKAQSTKPASGELVIGADQLMEMGGQIFDKPASMGDAKTRLQNMRGKEHRLIGAVAVCELGQTPWVHHSVTKLFMRDFSDEFLDNYLQAEGEGILKSVGAYLFEKRGSQLFRRVEGDFFSILGLSLLPLLAHLRTRGGAGI